MPAADSIISLAVAASAAVGGRELISLIFARRKTSAEAEAAAAGALASKADAAQTVSEAAAELVAPLTTQIRELRQQRTDDRVEHQREIEELRTEVDVLRRQARQRDQLAARHAPWDRQVAEKLNRLGQDVDEPPPLFLPATG